MPDKTIYPIYAYKTGGRDFLLKAALATNGLYIFQELVSLIRQDTLNDLLDNIIITKAVKQTNSSRLTDETEKKKWTQRPDSTNILIRPVWRRKKEITRQQFIFHWGNRPRTGEKDIYEAG